MRRTQSQDQFFHNKSITSDTDNILLYADTDISVGLYYYGSPSHVASKSAVLTETIVDCINKKGPFWHHNNFVDVAIWFEYINK